MTRVVGCAAIAALVISFSSSSSGATPDPALRPGATGKRVKQLQSTLIRMGFLQHGSTTGFYGPLTQRAVANFQRHATSALRKSFPSTGALDAKTRDALAQLAPEKGERGEKGHAPRPFWEGKRLRVVVVKAEHRTFVYDDAGKVVGIYQNAVGAPGSPTDSGLRTVSGKLDAAGCAALGRKLWNDPTVFGTHLVDLAYSGEELHGTNAPNALGTDASHGCVRHDNRDIPLIWNRCKVGDRVAIVQTLRNAHLRK